VKQQGYSLLLGVFALLGVGSVWIAGITIQIITHTADQTLALSQAQAALISYAVNYIDHYGAQGAGVGHFPCPDTDEPSRRAEGAEGAELDVWHRDGPNPPCAQQAVEHGWLPRHVDVRDGRYPFHTRSQQRLLYAVSGEFVNNPVGRVVNPATAGAIVVGQYTDVVAVLATPPLDADLSGSLDWLSPEAMANRGAAYSLIRTGDIRKQSMQRVGGWLVKHLNGAMAERCASAKDSQFCPLAQHSHLQCDLSAKSILLHWLNVSADTIDCENHEQYLASNFTLLEDVPLQRHWFMRNQWYRFVALSFDTDCLTIAGAACQFALMPVLDNVNMLTVRLQPQVDLAQQ